MITESPQPNIGAGTALGRRFWLLAAIAGVATGIAAGLLMALLRIVERLAWPPGATFLDAVEAAGPARRIAVVTAAGLLVASVRWLRTRPTGGHGGELTEAVWFEGGQLPVLRTLSSAVVSIVVVGLGASLGREAAPKQAGALIASRLARWTGLSPGRRRLLVALAAGAGMGAVYNVPFGGAAFALEVLLGTLALPLVPPALAVSGLATLTAWLFLPDRPTYQVAFFPVSAPLIVWSLLVGPLAGAASAFYVRLICWADARKPHGSTLLLAPVAVFAGLGIVALPLPQLLGNGKDVVQIAFDGQLGAALALAIVVLKPLVTAACLGSGAPGGLFTPSLTFGAVLGALCGLLWSHVWPGVPAGAYAMIGGAAVLAATTQGPISSVILLLELTHRIDTVMIPIALAIIGAIVVARLIDTRSVYSGRIHAGRNTAADGAISVAARYAELLQALLRNAGKPLRVIDREGHVLGEVSPARARSPTAAEGPLATATAGDFLE